MVRISVEVTTKSVDGEEVTKSYPMLLPCKRVALYDGEVRNLPDWMLDMVVPKEQPLDVGEVWTQWNRGLSLTIRGKYGYHIADKGSLIIDHGDHHYAIIKLEPVDWANDGKKSQKTGPSFSRT